MGYLAPKLNRRIQVCIANQTANADGGIDFGYTVQTTIWAEVKNTPDYISYIRGEQLAEKRTHTFTVRNSAVESLGKSFSAAFNTGFKEMGDLAQIKSDWFIFLERGSTVKGRLFKVRGLNRDERRKEYIVISADEIEERGTGAPE